MPTTDTAVRRDHRAPRPRRLVGAAVTLVAALALTGCLSANQTKVLDQINASRRAAGKGPVAANDQAMAKAQAWSDRMARTGVLEHTGGGTRVDTSGLPRWCKVGENVGQGTSTQVIHDTFLRSASHRDNIYGAYDRVGTGVTRVGTTVWVTQIFYKSC